MDNFEIPFLEICPEKVQGYFDINLTSMITLTTRFLSAFPHGKCCVVHITSLLGKVFVPGFPLYSIAKAARNAFMGILKAEMPGTRQFSYSPGPCDTEMFRSIPAELKNGFGEILVPEKTVQKLMMILKDDQYENGAIIDYYDSKLYHD